MVFLRTFQAVFTRVQHLDLSLIFIYINDIPNVPSVLDPIMYTHDMNLFLFLKFHSELNYFCGLVGLRKAGIFISSNPRSLKQ